MEFECRYSTQKSQSPRFYNNTKTLRIKANTLIVDCYPTMRFSIINVNLITFHFVLLKPLSLGLTNKADNKVYLYSQKQHIFSFIENFYQ